MNNPLGVKVKKKSFDLKKKKKPESNRIEPPD